MLFKTEICFIPKGYVVLYVELVGCFFWLSYMLFRCGERNVRSSPFSSYLHVVQNRRRNKGVVSAPGLLWGFQFLYSKSLSWGVGILTFPRILLSHNVILSYFYCHYLFVFPFFLPSYPKVYCFNVKFSLAMTYCNFDIVIFHPTLWPLDLCLFLSSEYACQYLQFILLCYQFSGS